MAALDGAQWTPEQLPRPATIARIPSSSTGQIARALLVASIAIAVIVGVFATGTVRLSGTETAQAAAHHSLGSGCAADPSSAAVNATYLVSAWGLPTRVAINLWVTHDGTTTGRPLGSTPDGTFNLDESSSTSGVWTYTFSGPTKKKHTAIYATCSVTAY